MMMKKVVLTSAIASMFLHALNAETHTGKTFFVPRSVGDNQAVEHTAWHHQIYQDYSNDKRVIRTHLQATAFYQGSVNEGEAGKYFCSNGNNNFRVGSREGGMNSHFLLHRSSATRDRTFELSDRNDEFHGLIVLSPFQEVYGARFDWLQTFNGAIKNWFFKLSAPIVHVENDLQLRIDDNIPVMLSDARQVFLRDFFAGRLEVLNDERGLQNPLKKGKIDGRRSATGLADITLALGYLWSRDQEKYAHWYADLLIPTGNKVRSDFLFEPIYGNGQHLGIGFGVDGGVELFQNRDGAFRLDLKANYRYLFDGTEQRIIGLKGDSRYPREFAHYALAARDGQAAKPLFPAVNVLARDVKVKPSSRLSGLVNFSFYHSKFIVDCGYNMYWKDRESVWLRNFKEERFGIAHVNADTRRTLTVAEPSNRVNQDVIFEIARDNLDLDSVKAPSQFTHKFYTGFAYYFDINKRNPVFVGAGASHEFTQNNAAFAQYTIWGKASIAF